MPKLSILYRSKFRAAAFVVEGVNLQDVQVIALELKKDRLSYALYGIFLALHLYGLAYYFRYTDKTREALRNSADKILFWDCCYFEEYRMLNRMLGKEKARNVFFWNPLSRWSSDCRYLKRQLDYLKARGFAFFTFDPADAEKYAISRIRNVNRKLPVQEDVKWDFYFIGAPKDRRVFIENLEKRLKAKGFTTNFKLVESKADYVSNYDNIKLSAQSKCIVDVMSPEQQGLTLRPFDALFLEKKLITNCASVKKFDFYDPANIYVIEGNDLNGLDEFMATPYKKLDETLVCRYEVNQWIRENFLN